MKTKIIVAIIFLFTIHVFGQTGSPKTGTMKVRKSVPSKEKVSSARVSESSKLRTNTVIPAVDKKAEVDAEGKTKADRDSLKKEAEEKARAEAQKELDDLKKKGLPKF